MPSKLWHAVVGGLTSTPPYSNKHARTMTQSSARKVVTALFVLGFLVSAGALTLTTITTGWWSVAFYVIAATGPCLPGLIVLGCVTLLTISKENRGT